MSEAKMLFVHDRFRIWIKFHMLSWVKKKMKTGEIVTKINPEVKKKWVEALRSNEYSQGASFLHADRAGVTRYCCLGVLCDLAVKEGAVPQPKGTCLSSNGCIVNQYGLENEGQLLPGEVMEWAGLALKYPVLEITEGYKAAWRLNDGDGAPFHTFAEIADLIEEQL